MIRKLTESIDKREWRFIIITTIAIILLTTLPYVYGWYQTPPNHTYAGLHSLTPGDIHVYFSWMEQVRQGHFISEDLYTSEPQARILLNSFWSFEGLIAKLTGLSNILVFQLSRIVLIPFFLFILYLISCFFWTDKLWRRISFIFLTFASGSGAVVSALLPKNIYSQGWYNWPLDLWAPESNNLLTMFQSPHLIASTLFLIIILFLAYLSFEKNKFKYSFIAGLFALALFQFHPFHIPTVFSVLAIYFFIQFIINIKKLKQKKEYLFNILKHALIILVISFPSILYWLLLQNFDFVTQIRTYQNVCLTPALWVTISSYGLILFLAIFASFKIIQKKQLTNKKLFLIVWLAVQFILLYSPLPFQRRVTQGLQVPMILLAVIGLNYIYKYIKLKLNTKKFDFYINNKALLVVVFILLFSTSNIYNWIREAGVFSEVYPQFYISNDVIEGYNWFKQNTAAGTVVLTDLYNGNFFPGKTGRKVYVGHGVETLFFSSKIEDMLWFYSINNLDDKKKKFLEKNNISYIFFSSREKAIGSFEPSGKNYLQRVFKKGETEIYRVKK